MSIILTITNYNLLLLSEHHYHNKYFMIHMGTPKVGIHEVILYLKV